MNVTIKNNGKCGIIVPGVGDLTDLLGMLPPGETMVLDESLTETDFMQHLISVGDIAVSAVPVAVAPSTDGDIDTLRDQAEMLGIVVNKRWGVAKLQEEIDKMTSDE